MPFKHLLVAPPKPAGGVLPGLDGLRAIAVLLVALSHQEVLGFGWIGVQIFFVLSGYLITRILYRARDLPLGSYLRDFYGRRMLRIFPLYYAVLAAIAVAWRLHLIKMPGIAEGLPYAAGYAYNAYHMSRSFVHSEIITHLWSLSVEEQFYLVWPLFIFLCPARLLRLALLAMIIAGPFTRALEMLILDLPGLPVNPKHEVALYVSTLSHVDAFAIGALFSLFPLGGATKTLLASLVLMVASGLAVVTWGHDVGPRSFGFPMGLVPAHGYLWGYTLINIFSAVLIDALAAGKALHGFFDSAALRYLGKISYGLYIFHYPMQYATDRILPGATPLAARIVVQFGVTVAIAAISYRLLEEPCLSLKERWFPGAGARKVPALAALSPARPASQGVVEP